MDIRLGIVNKHITTDLTIGRNLDRDGANRCILCLPYVGANNLDIDRRVCSVVGRAFGEVNVVIVFITGRAFMVKKDILPTTSLSKSTYSFECRHCDSRHVGRTIQHLHARIRRHVPHCIYYLQRRETTGHGEDGRQKFMQHELTLVKSLLNINQRVCVS